MGRPQDSLVDMNTPLTKGGQGRSDWEIEQIAWALVLVLGSTAFVGVVAWLAS